MLYSLKINVLYFVVYRELHYLGFMTYIRVMSRGGSNAQKANLSQVIYLIYAIFAYDNIRDVIKLGNGRRNTGCTFFMRL